MKSKFLSILVVLFVVCMSLTLFSACGESNKEGRVPVYQGMTISSQSTVLTAKAAFIASASVKAPVEKDDNGKHKGWHKGDYEGRDESIDQEKPFLEGNDDIEKEIESTLDVTGAGQTIYYATENEDIYIDIHIDNPDSYEIMSFTLNGKKYSSYMFEEGSDMETLILKYNVGSEGGIQRYTIDAIKYIDGTEIKDVIMNGEKTVLAGVRKDNQVNAEVSDVTITTKSVSFGVRLNDNDNLIADCEGCVKAVIYDGESILATKDLTIGDNKVSFDNLSTSTLYQYAIVGYYDNLSGEGFSAYPLYKEAFYTKSVVLFDNVVITQESIRFTFKWDDAFQNKTPTALKLYKDGNLTELSATATAVNDLLSDTIYKLVAEYENGEKTESISLEFKTEAKAVPTMEIVNTTKTDSTISAEYIFTDDDNVGSIDSVKLYKGNALIATNQKKQIVFANLGSHTEYEIVIAYSYDLNDGRGVQNETFKESCTTSPYLQFDSCKIINTSAVSEGETIYMQATLNNPAHALPSSVVVNGQTYNCTGSTDANKIYVEIVNDGQFEGGNTTLFIEKINMTLDGEIYTLTIDSNNSGTVFINGTLSIVSAEFVNKDGVAVVDYCTPDDGVYILLTLNNKTGYVIDSVTVDYDEVTALIKIDDEHYKIEKTLGYGWNHYTIQSVTYHNAYLGKTLGYECETNRVYKTNSSAVTEISTAEQLLKTKYNGGYYKLTDDIDLSGMEWTNLGTFDGVFDGNGHKILNMSNVSTVISKDIYIGLFKEGSGILINLEIKDMTVMLTLTGNVCNAYCGGVLARTTTDVKPGNAVFKNCTVTGDISVNNMTGGTADAGGIVGHVNGSQYLYIDSCNVNMNISLKNGDKNIGYAAGLCGGVLMQISDMHVYNCRISGSITAFDVAAINIYVPFSEDNVHYENNTCDVYLNGERKTILEDFHSDAEQEKY